MVADDRLQVLVIVIESSQHVRFTVFQSFHRFRGNGQCLARKWRVRNVQDLSDRFSNVPQADRDLYFTRSGKLIRVNYKQWYSRLFRVKAGSVTRGIVVLNVLRTKRFAVIRRNNQQRLLQNISSGEFGQQVTDLLVEGFQSLVISIYHFMYRWDRLPECSIELPMMEGLVYIHVTKISKERAIRVVGVKFQELRIHLRCLLATPGGVETYLPKESSDGPAVCSTAQKIFKQIDIKS